MKTASAIYKMLRVLDTSWYEIRVVQGNNIYGLDKLKSVTMHPMLTAESGISVGNACSTECRITLLEESQYWPRMAQFTVDFRISSGPGGTKSEWITAGTFYTDERSEDKDGNLSIIAFDGMMKADQSWTDKIPSASLPATWPITAYDWASMIQDAELATFYDLTQLDDNVAFIGLDTTTSIRDVLKSIAAVHAGNWMMTADEKLKLIQFENVTEPEEGQPRRYTNLEQAMVTFEDSPSLSPITGVHLETEAGTVVEAGNDNGYRIKTICDFSSTTGVAELCLSRTNQYSYKPFTAGNAYLDPITEIGDSVKIDGTIYQIMTIDWTFSKDPVADVSAPYDQEVDHEYTVVSQDAKTYRKAMSLVDQKMGDYVQWTEMSTAIIQNSDSVIVAAEGTYVTQEDYDETIAEIQSQLDGSIQTWSGNAVPTLNNEPAIEWITPTQKAEHVGDTYFVNSDAGIPEAGSYYRFENNNGVYSWQLLTDSVLTEALAQAAAAMAAAEDAQDTAEDAEGIARLKGRIFVVRPAPPYDVGDLWFNNTDSVIKVCMFARESGDYVSSDWVKRDSYADYNELDEWLAQYSETIQDILNQVDQKAETYYQEEDPMVEWGGATIAGIAVAGINVVGIDSVIGLMHKGDLWYRISDSTTWYWNGTTWVQQDVPDEVFDKIDGKAQVFVSTPYPPYAVGDLWFMGEEDDIMTCIHARSSTESYVENDWVKYNKYTDDSALDDFVTVTYKADLEVTQRDISARVQKDQSGTRTSFGWVLDETAHTWYSDNQEVMKVNRSGLSVTGNVTATTGYIGTSKSGFEITSTAIRNGMTSLSDTTHNGVYVGTNGIALGQGKFTVTSGGAVTASNLNITGGSIKLGGTTSNPVFNVTSAGAVTASNLSITGGTIKLGGTSSSPVFQVTSAGAVTASNLSITGGSIKIGGTASSPTFNVTSSGAVTAKSLSLTGGSININDKFIVNAQGNLTAESGTFKGNVYAKNIQASASNPTYGTFNGSGITPGTVTGGGSTGQIGQYTLNDYNTQRVGNYGAYSTASFNSDVQGGLYGGTAFNWATTQGGTRPAHFWADYITSTYSVYAGTDLYVELGQDNQLGFKNHYHTIQVQDDGTVKFGKPTNTEPNPFNIADTKKYKDGVKAVTVSSRAVLYCNASNYTDFDGSAFDCDMTGASYHYDRDGTTYGRLEVRNSDGENLKRIRVKLPSAGMTSVSQTTYSATGDYSASIDDGNLRYGSNLLTGRLQISLNNGTTKTCVVSMDGKKARDSVGVDTITAQTFSVVSSDKSIAVTNANTDYTSSNLRARVKIDLTSGNSVYARVSLNGTKAYTAGVDSVDALASSNNIGYEEDDHGDTDYDHIWVKLENDKVIGNIALPPGGGSNVSRVVLGNYGSQATVFPYYRQTSTTGTIKAVAQDVNGNELRNDDLDITELIRYVYNEGGGGGSLSWSIYQHYDMGEPDGWDCRVTCGDQVHTFWSASRIYD